jgi:phage-related tail protein
MCKILNFQNVWDEINKLKPGYDENNNFKTWEAVDIKYDGHISDVMGKKYNTFRDMFKYIKEPENTIHPQEKFHKNKVGYDYLQDKINYIYVFIAFLLSLQKLPVFGFCFRFWAHSYCM